MSKFPDSLINLSNDRNRLPQSGRQKNIFNMQRNSVKEAKKTDLKEKFPFVNRLDIEEENCDIDELTTIAAVSTTTFCKSNFETARIDYEKIF